MWKATNKMSTFYDALQEDTKKTRRKPHDKKEKRKKGFFAASPAPATGLDLKASLSDTARNDRAMGLQLQRPSRSKRGCHKPLSLSRSRPILSFYS